MLKILDSTTNALIEVRFYYEYFEPFKLEGLTGESFDEGRRGSIATVTIDGILAGQGTAICHPSDNFCRAIGRKKALTEAISALSKKTRSAIWAEYNTQCGF